MVKLIINHSSENALNALDINYNIVYQISNYSVRADNFNCHINVEDLTKLSIFEDTQIEIIEIYTPDGNTLLGTLTFDSNFYIISANIIVDENNVNVYAHFNTIVIPE